MEEKSNAKHQAAPFTLLMLRANFSDDVEKIAEIFKFICTTYSQA